MQEVVISVMKTSNELSSSFSPRMKIDTTPYTKKRATMRMLLKMRPNLAKRMAPRSRQTDEASEESQTMVLRLAMVRSVQRKE